MRHCELTDSPDLMLCNKNLNFGFPQIALYKNCPFNQLEIRFTVPLIDLKLGLLSL